MMSKDVKPLSLERARQILSPVYSLEDVERVFGVSYTEKQRKALRLIPYSEKTLRQCAGTHMLFPGTALTLLGVPMRYWYSYLNAKGGHARKRHDFFRVPIPVRWHLLRMGPVPGSFNKYWNRQCQLLRPWDEVPTAALVNFATMLHFKVAKQRLFEGYCVRTADVDTEGKHFDFGTFKDVGYDLSSYWGGAHAVFIGLASARKS